MNQSRSQAITSPVIIRSSFRLVRPLYTLSFVLLAVVYGINNNRPEPISWLLIFPAILFVWTVSRHIEQHYKVLTIENGKLRYQTGIFSRTTRSMDLAKVQDVRVRQSLLNRLLNIGTIELETAGEQGSLVIRNVDRPQAVADFILEIAKR